jgi:CheY-like chemotaxis protein/anti-sigma regulatory factor (Ser/Thr protein kinase)
LIDQRGQSLKTTLPDEPIWLDADTTRMAQVFSNLLNNAAKYTDQNGHIEIDATETAAGIRVQIRDDGIGIPKEVQPHIFDLFAQVDSSMERAQGGLGIGLTLVKSLIEMHQGLISVFSAGKGTGTTFTVRLPSQLSRPETDAAPQPEAEPAAGSKFRVLVVDDNEASAKTLGWTLEMLGHDPHLAHEGQQALELARTLRPDVVLLDIGLPGMNGYEVCRALRNEPLLHGLTIIAQTGWGQKEHLKRSEEAGFDHHMVKPINMDALEKILGSLQKAPRNAA